MATTPFIGQIITFGGNFAPRDWAFCNGQLLPIAQNTALFSIIGTIYGGDGRTTFGLPDLRGRVPVHAGRGPGLTDRRIGQRGGIENVTLNQLQIPSHNHGVKVAVSTDTGQENNPTLIIANHEGGFNEDPSANQVLGGVTQNNIGGNQSHTNVQPFECVNFIIALVGIYPSRS